MREKIKRFNNQKIPFMLVVGDKDVEQNGFSVRSRKYVNLGLMNIGTLKEYIKSDIEQGIPQYILRGFSVPQERAAAGAAGLTLSSKMRRARGS